MKNLQLLTLFVFLLLIGCSQEDDTEPGDFLGNGSFELILEGDTDRTLKGEAYFAQSILTSKSKSENGSVLVVTLTSDDDEEEIITVTVGKVGDLNGVNPGTYTIDLDSDDETELVNLGAFLKESLTIYLGASGTITLQKVENDLVEGSFSGVIQNANEKTLDISGEFTASGITQNL